jgi:hypothetical protein
MQTQQPTDRYRLGVKDGLDVATLYFDCADYLDAYQGWVILTDYGRPGVIPSIEQHLDGAWVKIDPATGETA